MVVPGTSLSVGKGADGSERAHRLRKGALAMGADVQARIVSYSMVLFLSPACCRCSSVGSGASKARDARTPALRQQHCVLPSNHHTFREPPTTSTSSRKPHPRPKTLRSPEPNFAMAVKPITGVGAAIECRGL